MADMKCSAVEKSLCATSTCEFTLLQPFPPTTSTLLWVYVKIVCVFLVCFVLTDSLSGLTLWQHSLLKMLGGGVLTPVCNCMTIFSASSHTHTSGVEIYNFKIHS